MDYTVCFDMLDDSKASEIFNCQNMLHAASTWAKSACKPWKEILEFY